MYRRTDGRTDRQTDELIRPIRFLQVNTNTQEDRTDDTTHPTYAETAVSTSHSDPAGWIVHVDGPDIIGFLRIVLFDQRVKATALLSKNAIQE